ncbi:MAG: hypothetical protein E7471_04510 [Ruminococcaceae bacterium]|nr:hypothetical protein [Oscillospiraceae bacterium]
MKRLMSFFLTICLLLSVVASSTLTVSAAATYDVGKAMNYAANHWNDGKGLCAEFVSNCVQAGGLNIKTMLGTKSCWDAIINKTGLSGKNLTLNSQGYVTKGNNGSLLAKGDVVIQWCYTCNLRPHILICGGYDSKGYATFYAHNGALNNRIYRFSTNSQHKKTCNIGAKVLQLSKLSSKSVSNGNQSSVSPAPTSNLKVNLTSYPTSIAKGSSYGLRGSVTSNYKITSVKGYIINSSGKAVQSTSETPNSTSMDIRYSKINNNLVFGNLSAGNYTLKVVAKDAYGKEKTWSTSFTVKAPASVSKNPDSTLKIELTSYPTSIAKGKSYGLRGSVTSNYKISWVKGYILNSSGKIVQDTLDTPNATSMDIRYAKVNDNLLFNKLAKGTYTLKVVARDTYGKEVTWSKQFKVK